MEENIFKDYLKGYINIHNDMLDIDLTDKKQEIERLTKIIEANDQLVKNYMKVADVESNDKEKHKEFEAGTKQYMENIKNAEKEIEDIKRTQEENEKRKEELENAKNRIRERAKAYKEEKLAQEHKNKLNNELQNKMYEYNAKEYETNSKIEELNSELGKFENIELETTEEEVKRIKLQNELRKKSEELKKELRKIQADRKAIQQQLNQETDMTKKINKDYILFLGQLSLIDKETKKIELKEDEKETNSQENDRQKNRIDETSENHKNDKTPEKSEINKTSENSKTGKPSLLINDKIKDKQIQEIESIKIDEKKRRIYIETNNGKTYEESLRRSIYEKLERYDHLNIRDVCQATAGGRIKGRLLEMKVNPGIICALSKYEYDNGLRDDKIRKYIKSIYNKNEELPFKLTHDLRKSSLGAINRLKMWICARAENEIPGTEVIFGKRFWNKNRALNKGKEENKTVKAEGKSDKLEKVEEYRKNGKKLLNDLENLKVENPDGHIEGNALEKLRTRRRSSCY